MLDRFLTVAAAVHHRLERSVADTGLSLAKLGFLHHLVKGSGSMPLGELADCLACGRSNVTQLADRLEADGLIRREPDPEDRRSVRAVITEEGRTLYNAASIARDAAERELLAVLDPDDPRRLSQVLERLARIVC